MRLSIFILMFLCFLTNVNAQLNTSLLGAFGYEDELSDVWGYVDEEGNEYALVGENAAFSIVDVTNPTTPVEVYRIEGPSSIWRDIKVWDNKAYVTNETGEGLLIVDLDPLPQNTNLTAQNFDTGGWTSAHNLYIDENGICYIFGANRGNGGAIMYDLTQDPYELVEVGDVNEWYAHDGMARGDTLYLGNVLDGFFSIVDVSDKANHEILATMNTSFNFTHNCWVSDDGNYLYTTDEKSDAYIGAYDISDVENIQELDLWQSSPGNGVIPHNTHFLNNYLVTSYYSDGLSVLDVTYPYNMIDVGNYDTSEDYEGNGFHGAWGAYPWLPSGNVLITDIETGLYILGVEYQRGCYLEGTITDADTDIPLSGVSVSSSIDELAYNTGINGFYASGTSLSGVYDITYYKPGYLPQTISTTLQNGVLIVQDVELQIDANFSLSGTVNDGSESLQDVNIVIYNEEFNHELQSDLNGEFLIDTFFEGSYTVTASMWGFEVYCDELLIDEANNVINISLSAGYEDHFESDQGWEVVESTELGNWERGEPNGTVFGDGFSNPEYDSDWDCGTKAWVTGNADSPDLGLDDLDTLITVLKSPALDLTSYQDPYLTYQRWITSITWSSNEPNDSLKVYVTNGTDSVLVNYVTFQSENQSNWESESHSLSDKLDITDDMHVYFIAGDHPENQLFEVGIDNFKITEGDLSAIEINEIDKFVIYPNPLGSNSQLFINKMVNQITIFDLSGKVVQEETNKSNFSINNLSSGIYVLRIGFNGEYYFNKLLIK